jgi:hypothetical protein
MVYLDCPLCVHDKRVWSVPFSPWCICPAADMHYAPPPSSPGSSSFDVFETVAVDAVAINCSTNIVKMATNEDMWGPKSDSEQIERIMLSIDLTGLPTPRKSEVVVKPEIAKVE